MKDLRKKVRLFLENRGYDSTDSQIMTNPLAKYDTPNFMPKSELAGYLRHWRELLDNDYRRSYCNHEYEVCFVMWWAFSKIWTWRYGV